MEALVATLNPAPDHTYTGCRLNARDLILRDGGEASVDPCGEVPVAACHIPSIEDPEYAVSEVVIAVLLLITNEQAHQETTGESRRQPNQVDEGVDLGPE